MAKDLKHATKVFERVCNAPVEQVYQAFVDPAVRALWGAPSETTAFFYDQTEFNEGGQDIFRCGSLENPQYRGVTTYLDIVPNERIVSSEVVETAGQKLLVTLSTTTFSSVDGATEVTVTAQLTSFGGGDMIRGAESGHNASLDNLAKMWNH